MEQQWDVIVVGGGLAGLAAGVTATAGGAETLVLDAGAADGRARTHAERGFVFNRKAVTAFSPGLPPRLPWERVYRDDVQPRRGCDGSFVTSMNAQRRRNHFAVEK